MAATLTLGPEMGRFSKEKRSYWTCRLHDLLRPVPVMDIVVMSWAIEAIREGREKAARRHLEFLGGADEHKIGEKYFVPPWSVDAVLREKISLGSTKETARYLNLKSWKGVFKLLNVYAGLSNVESVMDHSPSEVLAAMPRLFWPQYDWQIGASNMLRLGRAWHVYATDEGKAAFSTKHGVELETFLKVGFGIYVGTEGQPAIRPSSLAALGITSNQLDQVRQIIGNTLAGHYIWTRDTGNPEIPRDFLRSITKERPIFEINDPKGRAYYIPSRAGLMLRITDGLYYDIVSDPDARRSSGQAFEELCFKMIRHYIDPDILVRREQITSYGVSADILVDNRAASTGLIIECKNRRLPQRVLTSPDPFKEHADAFGDVIDGIVQIWRTHNDIYSESQMRMAGIVLQDDPWALLGSAFVSKLFSSACEKADKLEIPDVNRVPVVLVGYFDFEHVLRNYDFSRVFEASIEWSRKPFHGWELVSVLRDREVEKKTKAAFNYDELVTNAVPWWGQF